LDFSFNSIKDRIITSLRSKSEWANILYFSTNMRLIEAVAKEIEELARYDEYLTRETKWDLARNKSSLVTQAAVLGYKPHRKIGARQKLWVSSKEKAFSPEWNQYTVYEAGDVVRYGEQNTLYEALVDNQGVEPTNTNYWKKTTAVHSSVIGIPKYSIFKTENDIYFTSMSSVDLLTTENYAEIDVVQGIPRTFTTIAQGLIYEEIEIENDSIDNSFYELRVNNDLWTEYNDIRQAEADDKAYQILNKLDFTGIIIRFGNNLTGKKLSAGDTITFKYVETLGELGDALSKGVVNTVVSTLVDNKGETVDGYCYNDEVISGGKDVEHIEDIRSNAKYTFQSGYNVVGKNDYKIYLLNNFDFIQKCVVWGAYEQNIDDGKDPWDWISTQENLVYISAFTTGETPTQLQNNQKVEIIQDINEKKPPTDIIIFKDVVFVNMIFNTTAYLSSTTYLLSETKTLLEQAIQEEYNITNLDFEQNIYETNYKAFIDNFDEVRYHNTTIQFYNVEDFTSGDYSQAIPYEASATAIMIPVKTKSVYVYIKDTSDEDATYVHIGTDNGGGGFNPTEGYDLSGSTINYNTGAIQIKESSGMSGDYSKYEMKVVYSTSEDDLILQGRNHIFYLREVNVETLYLTE